MEEVYAMQEEKETEEEEEEEDPRSVTKST